MKLVKLIRLVVSGVALAVMSSAQPANAAIGVGDAPPDVKLPGSDGKTYNLVDFKGKQAVVIAWYPRAFTGG